MSLPILGYWDIRGFVQPIRLLLQYLGVDYADKRYPLGPAPDFNRDEWLADKFSLGLRFPNIPYWIDEEANVKLTESKAILKYLAKTKGASLVPETPELQAEADIVEGVAHDVQIALVDLTYSPTGIPETPLEVALTKQFESLAELLGDRQWVTGDKLSYIDFYLYEVLFQFEKYNTEFLKPYPALENYTRQFEAIPELSEYAKAVAELPCYSAKATLHY